MKNPLWKTALLHSGHEFISEDSLQVTLKCSREHTFTIRKASLRRALKKGTTGCDACHWEEQYQQTREKAFQALEKCGLKLLAGDPKTKNESLQLQCLRDHIFPTKLEYVLKAAKNGTSGCGLCRDEKHSENAHLSFFEELKKEGYEPLEPYTDARAKVKIQRLYDGAINYVSRLDWVTGRKWPKAPSIRLTKEDMQQTLDEKRPGYRVIDSSNYKSKYDLITIECDGNNDSNEKHVYETQWQIVLYYRCRKCAGAHQSWEETDFRKEVEKTLGINCQTQYPLVGTRRSLDLYFSDEKIGIEYCGLWFHSTEFKRPSEHLKKLKLANQQGIRLLTVFEDEWKEKQSIVLSKIKSVFKKYDRTIYARNCQIVELTKAESRGFFNSNHLQGYTSQKVCFGLVYKNEIVAAMSFGSFTRSSPEQRGVVIELKRLAFAKNTLVIGGSSRLLKRGEEWSKLAGFKTIISFADLRWSAGEVYRVLGFSLKNNYIRPSKHYFKGRVRWNAQSLKLKPEERALGKTEKELRAEQGFKTIYDCGHQRWEKFL